MSAQEPQPFILSFRTPLAREGVDPFDAPDVRYDALQGVWLDAEGVPLWASRSKSPPTATTTAGHTIKSGYTPSGKWKPQTYVPAKTDRRAGK